MCAYTAIRVADPGWEKNRIGTSRKSGSEPQKTGSELKAEKREDPDPKFKQQVRIQPGKNTASNY